MLERLGAVATLPTMLTPMIAALIMRLFVTREGLKGSLGFLRSPKYYLAALVAPPVFVTAVVLIVQALGLGEFRWSEATWSVYSMLMGVIWGVWHLPLLLAGLNYPGVNVWMAIIVFTFMTVALSFTYTWFYVASSGSVLVAAVFHASTNQFSDTFWLPPFLSAATPFAPSLVGVVLIMALVAVVYGLFKRSVHVKDPVALHPSQDSGT